MSGDLVDIGKGTVESDKVEKETSTHKTLGLEGQQECGGQQSQEHPRIVGRILYASVREQTVLGDRGIIQMRMCGSVSSGVKRYLNPNPTSRLTIFLFGVFCQIL